MALLRRSARLPDQVRARLTLRDDRVLACAELADHRWAVASRRALHVVDDTAVRRFAWAEIDRGSLDPEDAALHVHLVCGADLVLALGPGVAARPFAVAFRERVQSSVVSATPVPVPGGPAVVSVRRDEDGALFVQVIGPGTVDLADPRTAALVADAEARAREAVGLP